MQNILLGSLHPEDKSRETLANRQSVRTRTIWIFNNTPGITWTLTTITSKHTHDITIQHLPMTWTLHIAHVSHSTSQLHIATAFHFFKVNILSDFWDSGSPRSTPSLSSAIFAVSTNHTGPYSVDNTNVVAPSGGKHVYLDCCTK